VNSPINMCINHAQQISTCLVEAILELTVSFAIVTTLVWELNRAVYYRLL